MTGNHNKVLLFRCLSYLFWILFIPSACFGFLPAFIYGLMLKNFMLGHWYGFFSVVLFIVILLLLRIADAHYHIYLKNKK